MVGTVTPFNNIGGENGTAETAGSTGKNAPERALARTLAYIRTRFLHVNETDDRVSVVLLALFRNVRAG